MTRHSSNSPDALPAALDEALRTRADAESLRATWRAIPTAEALSASPDADARREAAWARLRARLDDPTRERTPFSDPTVPVLRLADDDESPARREPPQSRGIHGPRPGARLAMRLAAAIVLAVALGAGWQSVPQRLEAAAGGPARRFVLTDGSRLTLGPGSVARVPRGFRTPIGLPAAAREVTLDGEGFFDVAHDGRPFMVQTREATVRVLGTRFDVRADRGVGGGDVAAGGTRVAVEEGRVAVATRDGSGRAVELGRGEGIVLASDAPFAVQRVEVSRLATWRTGGFAAIDEPLAVVLAELQRRAGVAITLEGGAATAERARERVSLFYPRIPAIESVLADLCTARGLTYRRTSRGYVIGAAAP